MQFGISRIAGAFRSRSARCLTVHKYTWRANGILENYWHFLWLWELHDRIRASWSLLNQRKLFTKYRLGATIIKLGLNLTNYFRGFRAAPADGNRTVITFLRWFRKVPEPFNLKDLRRRFRHYFTRLTAVKSQPDVLLTADPLRKSAIKVPNARGKSGEFTRIRVQRNTVVTRWYIAVLLQRNNFDHNPRSHAGQHLFIPRPCFLPLARKSAGALMLEIKCYALLYWVGDLRWLPSLAFELLSPANLRPTATGYRLRFKVKWRAVRAV